MAGAAADAVNMLVQGRDALTERQAGAALTQRQVSAVWRRGARGHGADNRCAHDQKLSAVPLRPHICAIPSALASLQAVSVVWGVPLSNRSIVVCTAYGAAQRQALEVQRAEAQRACGGDNGEMLHPALVLLEHAVLPALIASERAGAAPRTLSRAYATMAELTLKLAAREDVGPPVREAASKMAKSMLQNKTRLLRRRSDDL